MVKTSVHILSKKGMRVAPAISCSPVAASTVYSRILSTVVKLEGIGKIF
jgi:hypothetical protein